MHKTGRSDNGRHNYKERAMNKILERLLEKVDVSTITLILLLILAGLLCLFVTIIKNRKTIYASFVASIERKRKQDEYVQQIVENTGIITTLQQQVIDLQERTNKYFEYRSRDREQSFEKQKDLMAGQQQTMEAVQKVNAMLTLLQQGMIEQIGEQIIRRCKEYTKLGGIPENELEDFQRSMDVYTSIGGNHGLQKRFDKVIRELPLIPEEEILIKEDN